MDYTRAAGKKQERPTYEERLSFLREKAGKCGRPMDSVLAQFRP